MSSNTPNVPGLLNTNGMFTSTTAQPKVIHLDDEGKVVFMLFALFIILFLVYLAKYGTRSTTPYRGYNRGSGIGINGYRLFF